MTGDKQSASGSGRPIDEFTGIETTGHEWDGIRELDNPMPRWWLWTFYATIIFAFGYVIYYPAIPLVDGATPGLSGETNRGRLEAAMAAVRADKAPLVERIKQLPIEEIPADEELYRYAVAGGGSLFKIHCSQCHGSGATGSPGFPNLNDDDWIWGGDLATIATTIGHGVRNTQDEDARISDMPAFGRDDILPADEIRKIAEYVLKLSGQEADSTLAAQGATLFSDNCASCHGEDGRGVRDVGSPNLADALWLYGGTRADILRQIQSPQHGVMPPWLARLGEDKVKQLALYVHSLGGGEAAPAGADVPQQ